MDIKELKEKLKEGIVEFEYKKKDGTIRKAKGTTNPEIINSILKIEVSETIVENKERKYSETQIRYFDIDKEGWRSFCEENFNG